MNKSDWADKIESWLSGRLSPQEIAQMEQLRTSDSEFAEAVSLHKLTLQAGKNLSEQHLKSQVLHWLNTEPAAKQPENTGKPTNSSINYQNWTIGFLLLAVLALLGYIWFQNRNQAKTQLVQMALATENEKLKTELENQKAESAVTSTNNTEPSKQQIPDQPPAAPVVRPLAFYKMPDDWSTTMRSGEAPAGTTELLTAGVAAFKSGKNATAASNAKRALANDPNNRTAHRLLAHALIRQGYYLEASHEFNWLMTAFPAKKDEAEWNLLLCYKAMSETAEGNRLYAKMLKQILDNQTHTFYKQAKILQKK